jgi:polysaccharide biosynthesis/export protein PslD
MSVSRRLLMMGMAAVPLAACGGVSLPRVPNPMAGPPTSAGFPDIAFADWTDAEPEYVLYPNDEIEVATPTAPELTRTLKVGPDGRISLPLLGQVMAADRTLAELERDVSAGYASQLVRPVVEITLKQAGPIRVWVAGEVRTPGVYEMTGDIDAYQAVIQAGDFLPTARTQEVALIRRGPGGRRMMRVLDLRPRRGLPVALRRGDILYVPRSTLGELANFFTQIRNALPIGFNYTINGQYQQF